MKQLLFLSSILCALAPAQAQLEWAPVGAKYYHSAWNEWQGDYVQISEVTGDTVIAGKNCRVLDTWWRPGCEGREFTYEEEGRVYLYDEESGRFGLVFDFNKGAGEFWWVPVCSQWTGVPADSMQIFVDSVGLTHVNGMAIRTQYVTWSHPWYQYTEHTKIYEGIGNAPVPYFFWGVYGLAVNVFLHTFNCYESPTHGIFNFVGGQPCGVYTATGEAQAAVEQLRLYPNPAGESLNVELPKGGKGQLALYDAQGRLLKTQSLDTVPESWSLDVSALPAGMYLLLYRREGGAMALGKFVRE
jgi:hypothetical protein